MTTPAPQNRVIRARTGLRNRKRSGGSTYARRLKGHYADRYGAFANGHRTQAETIAGRNLSYELNRGD